MEPDHYSLLGIDPSADESAVRTAFRDLVRDAMDDLPRFAALTEAFETLKDPQRRAEYDARRKSPMDKTVAGADATAAFTNATVQLPANAAPDPIPGVCRGCGTPATPGEGYCLECGLLAGSTPGAAPTALEPPTLVDALGRTFVLRPGVHVVGREGAEVILPDKTVSRRHATLTVGEGNVVTLEEQGSTNGTRVNGAPAVAGSPVRLRDGAQLQFGGIKATLRIPAGPEPERLGLPAGSGKPVAAIAAAADAAARLVAADGTTHVLKSAATTFGRRADNDVVLSGDAFVSGAHARIVYENGAFLLVDLGSTNGTRLRGRRLAPQSPEPLTEGDTIHLGQTQFTFHAPRQAEELRSRRT
jgi:pSer/pThr/pTyr-binding forkhead associated (FHA) protein